MRAELGALLVGAGAAMAWADQIMPLSYDMLNGETGSWTYWDDTYNGTGNTTQSLSPLSGGLGDLTDGVIATSNWNVTPGPYVGWDSVDPAITFHFGSNISIESVVIYADDSNGAGGVSTPGSVRVRAGAYENTFIIPDGSSGAPIGFTIEGFVLQSEAVELTFYDGTSRWVMISEIQFFGVPAPSTLACIGLAFIPGRSRPRRRM